jgi:hypothetical protein
VAGWTTGCGAGCGELPVDLTQALSAFAGEQQDRAIEAGQTRADHRAQRAEAAAEQHTFGPAGHLGAAGEAQRAGPDLALAVVAEQAALAPQLQMDEGGATGTDDRLRVGPHGGEVQAVEQAVVAVEGDDADGRVAQVFVERRRVHQRTADSAVSVEPVGRLVFVGTGWHH